MKPQRESTTKNTKSTKNSSIEGLRTLLLPSFVLFVLSVVQSSFAAGIVLAPDKAEIEAGEPVVIRGTATLDAGMALKAPEPDALKETPFSILNLSLSPEGGIAMTVAAFDTGELTLPALDWGGIKSPPVRFKVTAPAGDKPGADIYEIRGPVRVVNLLPYLLLALALLAGLGWWLWKRYGAGEEPEEVPREVRVLTAYEAALQRLARLVDSGLWEQGAAKDFYIELSEILRDYLQARFDFDAKTLTTAALTRKLRELELDPAVCREARQFLDDSDLVKFAKWRPDPQTKDHDIERLRSLLESTKPAPSPVGEVAP